MIDLPVVDLPGVDLTAQDYATNHRGRYILERGTWRATCADCGWSVEGTTRRRAATIFRSHIQSMRPSESNPRRSYPATPGPPR